jgi:hypothetical protein
MAELARKLDMGRASLYRAFDSLEVSGEVKKINGVIYMLKKRRAGGEPPQAKSSKFYSY